MSQPNGNRPNQSRNNGNNNGNGNHRNNNQRRNGPNRRKPNDLWRETGPLPDVQPITVSEDVGALIRSLGDLPLAGAGNAGTTFETVAERAAAIARALAVSADLLAERD